MYFHFSCFDLFPALMLRNSAVK